MKDLASISRGADMTDHFLDVALAQFANAKATNASHWLVVPANDVSYVICSGRKLLADTVDLLKASKDRMDSSKTNFLFPYLSNEGNWRLASVANVPGERSRFMGTYFAPDSRQDKDPEDMVEDLRATLEKIISYLTDKPLASLTLAKETLSSLFPSQRAKEAARFFTKGEAGLIVFLRAVCHLTSVKFSSLTFDRSSFSSYRILIAKLTWTAKVVLNATPYPALTSRSTPEDMAPLATVLLSFGYTAKDVRAAETMDHPLFRSLGFTLDLSCGVKDNDIDNALYSLRAPAGARIKSGAAVKGSEPGDRGTEEKRRQRIEPEVNVDKAAYEEMTFPRALLTLTNNL